MPRTMLYHRTLPPQIVESADECDRLLRDGWADTPAAFTDGEGPDGDPHDASPPDVHTRDDDTPAPLPARRRRKP